MRILVVGGLLALVFLAVWVGFLPMDSGSDTPAVRATLLGCTHDATTGEAGGGSSTATSGQPTPAAGPKLTAEAVGRLPEALVKGLCRAVATADYDAMLVLVAEAVKCDEPVGRQLRRWVENFEYAALETVLMPHKMDG